MRIATIVATLAASPVLPAQEPVVRLAPADVERRWVVASWPAPEDADAPVQLRDASGVVVPTQRDADLIRWLVPRAPAGAALEWTMEPAASRPAMTVLDEGDGVIAIRDADGRLVTRYHGGNDAVGMGKPFFHPLVVRGVDVLRGWPVVERDGEARDHPHHTGLFFAHGDVDGVDYWSSAPVRHRRVVRREAGPVFARLVVEQTWGQHAVATLDVRVADASPDLVMDWTITLRATTDPAVLGRTKEGTFAARLGPGLSGDVDILDAEGHRGEAAVRAARAPWVDYVGAVDGTPVGVAVMNLPGSFRFPTTWHVRAYGLFAANPFMADEPVTLEADTPLVLRYRVYGHGAERAGVEAVYEGAR